MRVSQQRCHVPSESLWWFWPKLLPCVQSLFGRPLNLWTISPSFPPIERQTNWQRDNEIDSHKSNKEIKKNELKHKNQILAQEYNSQRDPHEHVFYSIGEDAQAQNTVSPGQLTKHHGFHGMRMAVGHVYHFMQVPRKKTSTVTFHHQCGGGGVTGVVRHLAKPG